MGSSKTKATPQCLLLRFLLFTRWWRCPPTATRITHKAGWWRKLASSDEWLRYDSSKQNGWNLVSTSVWPWQQRAGQEEIIGSRCGKALVCLCRFLERNSFFPPSEFLNLVTMSSVWGNPTRRPFTQIKPRQVVETPRVVTPIWSKTSDDMWWRHFH